MRFVSSGGPGYEPRRPQRICGVSRGRGLVPATLLIVAGLLLMLPAWYVWPTLRFAPSPTASRLPDYALAIAVLVPALGGLYCLSRAALWVAFVLWPARMQIEADARALYLRLGPFGRRRLDWVRMQSTYAFEEENFEEVDPERLNLEPREEMRRHLPRMRHPDAGEVNVLLERFALADEAALAAALRPFLVTGERAKLDEEAG